MFFFIIFSCHHPSKKKKNKLNLKSEGRYQRIWSHITLKSVQEQSHENNSWASVTVETLRDYGLDYTWYRSNLLRGSQKQNIRNVCEPSCRCASQRGCHSWTQTPLLITWRWVSVPTFPVVLGVLKPNHRERCPPPSFPLCSSPVQSPNFSVVAFLLSPGCSVAVGIKYFRHGITFLTLLFVCVYIYIYIYFFFFTINGRNIFSV